MLGPSLSSHFILHKVFLFSVEKTDIKQLVQGHIASKERSQAWEPSLSGLQPLQEPGELLQLHIHLVVRNLWAHSMGPACPWAENKPSTRRMALEDAWSGS